MRFNRRLVLSFVVVVAGCGQRAADWSQGEWRYNSAATLQRDKLAFEGAAAEKVSAVEAEHANDRFIVDGSQATLTYLDTTVKCDFKLFDGERAVFQGVAENRVGQVFVQRAGDNRMDVTLHFSDGEMEDISLGLFEKM